MIGAQTANLDRDLPVLLGSGNTVDIISCRFVVAVLNCRRRWYADHRRLTDPAQPRDVGMAVQDEFGPGLTYHFGKVPRVQQRLALVGAAGERGVMDQDDSAGIA